MEFETSTASDTIQTTWKVSLSFLIGAGIGAALAHYLTKRYYSKKADEGVKEVLERFDPVHHLEETPNEKKNETVKAEPIKEPSPSEWPVGDETPYAITLAEYTDNEEYDKEDGLVYYEGDDTLTDKYDHIIETRTVFGDAFDELSEHFGDDEKDILYLRNPRLKVDYEICLEHTETPEYILREGDLDDED